MSKGLLIVALFLVMESASQPNPQWATTAVWYQVFPERFCNGDTTNDPTAYSMKGAYPHDENSPWQIHPWASDWYKLQPWEQANKKSLGYNIQRRRYGGDIQGILNKLDYLKELGITAIYLNPIFYAPSLHKYDAICFHHVDPYLGPNPKEDLEIMATETPDDPNTWHWTEADKLALKLIEEVHQRGMKIIFDGVWNHLGIENVFIKDVAQKGQQSKYANWFNISDWNAKGEMGMPFKYGTWFGVKELPEIKEDKNGIVKGPKEYIFNCTKRWMLPNGNVKNGIDGWRLDAAYSVHLKFWIAWNTLVHQLNKDSYTTAEIVDGPAEVKRYLDAGFNAVMNYNFAYAAHDYFINQKLTSTGQQLDAKNQMMMKTYGKKMYCMQNLYNSHDAQRLGSAVANPDLGHFEEWGSFFGMSQAEHNGNYNTSKPNAEQIKTMKLLIAYQMCMPGAPMFLYGDEAGMWGANDPDCRKPMVWQNDVYENEEFDANGRISKNDVVKFDSAIFNYYKTWIALRNTNPALSLGTYKMLASVDSAGLFIFERRWKKEVFYIVVNRSEKDFESIWWVGRDDNIFRQLFPSEVLLGFSPFVNALKMKINYSVRAKSISVLKRNSK